MSRSLVDRYALPADEIEVLSFRRLDEAVGGRWPWPEPSRTVARRMCYAAGDPGLVASIVIHPQAVAAGMAALQRGAALVTDVQMVAVALDRGRAERLGCPIIPALAGQDPPGGRQGGDAGDAGRLPRCVGAVRCLGRWVDGAVCVFGTAPTALLALLDEMDAGRARPALIIGTPVGFVAAAEAKEELERRDVPYITVRGTRGGAALAAAAANALLRMAAP